LLSTVSLVLNVVVLILLFVLFLRKNQASPSYEKDFQSLERLLERTERTTREEAGSIRQEGITSAKANREELAVSMERFSMALSTQMIESAIQQKHTLESFSSQLNTLTQMNQTNLEAIRHSVENKLELVRSTVEERLKNIQEDNGKKLELMRVTVDEKLNSTLEQRLGESFKLVSERLEQVHKSMGEMQSLANGVGDLKKVLTNVRNRGTLGEIQLQALLEQILSPDQFDMNVVTKPGSNDRVEFAIKIPSKDDMNTMVYLPIDSKFPLESYERLLDAYDAGDSVLVNELSKQLEQRIKLEAKTIQSKYISVPHTCDFAIMFLPMENLFGEVLRRPGLFEQIQRENKIIITGPTTLSAILNSLYMGLRTLAIQKHSSEVWQVLGAIKTEFGNFSTVLAKTKKKLQEASNQIENAQRNSRRIERKLRSVEDLSFPEQAKEILQWEELEEEELLAAE
jgi:DNA recombination protein RmuC